MNNLPDTGTTVPPISTPSQAVGSIGKEKEILSQSVESPLKDVGIEMELPKEVASAGVTVKSTVIPIPPPIAKLGVKPAGQNIPVVSANTLVLPLTDDQIANGLHASITSSLRWLAEWCRHQLKALHIVQ